MSNEQSTFLQSRCSSQPSYVPGGAGGPRYRLLRAPARGRYDRSSDAQPCPGHRRRTVCSLDWHGGLRVEVLRPQLRRYQEDVRTWPVLVWTSRARIRSISSAPFGGGL